MSDWHMCPLCGAESDPEVVVCVDGHGPDCPERVCTRCDEVVFVGPIPLAPAVRRADRQRADRQRAAR